MGAREAGWGSGRWTAEDEIAAEAANFLNRSQLNECADATCCKDGRYWL